MSQKGLSGEAGTDSRQDREIMRRRIALWALVVFAAGLGWGGTASAEFYKYIDRSGKTHYVDEIWKVPDEYRGQVGRYREKYDHLSGARKEEVLEADQNRQREYEIEQQRQTDIHLQDLDQRQEAERLQQVESEVRRQLKAAETQVTLVNNQILVPVAFTNTGMAATAHLVMDTGATHTVLYRPVANRLNILTLSKGQSRIAGGHMVHAEIGKVDLMQVGPITARDFPVVILPFEGIAPAHGGLLGMDFLSTVEYSIDYDRSTIRWKLRNR
jgi:predicted aspartyl protease